MEQRPPSRAALAHIEAPILSYESIPVARSASVASIAPVGVCGYNDTICRDGNRGVPHEEDGSIRLAAGEFARRGGGHEGRSGLSNQCRGDAHVPIMGGTKHLLSGALGLGASAAPAGASAASQLFDAAVNKNGISGVMNIMGSVGGGLSSSVYGMNSNGGVTDSYTSSVIGEGWSGGWGGLGWTGGTPPAELLQWIGRTPPVADQGKGDVLNHGHAPPFGDGAAAREAADFAGGDGAVAHTARALGGIRGVACQQSSEAGMAMGLRVTEQQQQQQQGQQRPGRQQAQQQEQEQLVQQRVQKRMELHLQQQGEERRQQQHRQQIIQQLIRQRQQQKQQQQRRIQQVVEQEHRQKLEGKQQQQQQQLQRQFKGAHVSGGAVVQPQRNALRESPRLLDPNRQLPCVTKWAIPVAPGPRAEAATSAHGKLSPGRGQARAVGGHERGGGNGVAVSEELLSSPVGGGGASAKGSSPSTEAGGSEVAPGENVGGREALEDDSEYIWCPPVRVKGKEVYARLKINENASEITAVKREIADAVAANRSDAVLRDLGANLDQWRRNAFIIRLGDVIELHSHSDSTPYVGKLVGLDRDTEQCTVRWFYTRREIRRDLIDRTVPREIFLATVVQKFKLHLNAVKRKVKAVSELPPPGETLDEDTYLCRYGYNQTQKQIVPLPENYLTIGQLEIDKPKRRVTRKGAEGSGVTRVPSSPSIISTPRARDESEQHGSDGGDPDVEDEDEDLVQHGADGISDGWPSRADRIGPDYQVEVPQWTGPAGRSSPSLVDTNVAKEILSSQQLWSVDTPPISGPTLQEYLKKANARRPIPTGTIVYIRPDDHGQWGDGREDPWYPVAPTSLSHAHTAAEKCASGLASSSSSRGTTDPRNTRVMPPQLLWGLVVNAPPGAPSRMPSPILEPTANSDGPAATAAAVADAATSTEEVRVRPPSSPLSSTALMKGSRATVAGDQGTSETKESTPPTMVDSKTASSSSLLHAASESTAEQRYAGAEQRGAIDGGSPNSREKLNNVGSEMRRETGRQGLSDVVWVWGKNRPLPVARARLVPGDFEEEAMNVLRDEQGDVAAALLKITSPEFEADLGRQVLAADELWTEEQVSEAVCVCDAVKSRLKRNTRKNDGRELGDWKKDEENYGVPGKSFQQVVDFSRRYPGENRFGQSIWRTSYPAPMPLVRPGVILQAGTKRARPRPGAYADKALFNRQHRRETRTGGIGAAFGNGLMVGSRRGTTNKAAISRGGRYLDGNSSSSSSGSSGNGERGAAKRSRGENGVHGQSKLSSRIGRSVGSVGRIDRVIARHGTGVDEEVEDIEESDTGTDVDDHMEDDWDPDPMEDDEDEKELHLRKDKRPTRRRTNRSSGNDTQIEEGHYDATSVATRVTSAAAIGAHEDIVDVGQVTWAGSANKSSARGPSSPCSMSGPSSGSTRALDNAAIAPSSESLDRRDRVPSATTAKATLPRSRNNSVASPQRYDRTQKTHDKGVVQGAYPHENGIFSPNRAAASHEAAVSGADLGSDAAMRVSSSHTTAVRLSRHSSANTTPAREASPKRRRESSIDARKLAEGDEGNRNVAASVASASRISANAENAAVRWRSGVLEKSRSNANNSDGDGGGSDMTIDLSISSEEEGVETEAGGEVDSEMEENPEEKVLADGADDPTDEDSERLFDLTASSDDEVSGEDGEKDVATQRRMSGKGKRGNRKFQTLHQKTSELKRGLAEVRNDAGETPSSAIRIGPEAGQVEEQPMKQGCPSSGAGSVAENDNGSVTGDVSASVAWSRDKNDIRNFPTVRQATGNGCATSAVDAGDNSGGGDVTSTQPAGSVTTAADSAQSNSGLAKDMEELFSRLKEALNKQDFEELVMGMQRFRTREISTEELVMHAADCLKTLKGTPDDDLISSFSFYLPDGFTMSV